MLSMTNVCIGTNSAGGGGVSIIEFTIVDVNNIENVLSTYQCEDGMTWQEFINSDYNIDKNFYINNNQVYSTKQGTVRVAFTEEVFSNMAIKNQTYLVSRTGQVGTKY